MHAGMLNGGNIPKIKTMYNGNAEYWLKIAVLSWAVLRNK